MRLIIIIATICLVLLIGLISYTAGKTVGMSVPVRHELQECIDQGGEPYYDLCIKKPFEIIKLPGIDYAPEVDEYR